MVRKGFKYSNHPNVFGEGVQTDAEKAEAHYGCSLILMLEPIQMIAVVALSLEVAIPR